MLAVDLIAWTQLLLLHGDLAVAAQLTHGQRRLWLRVQHSGVP
jgi:hypothetical protein